MKTLIALMISAACALAQTNGSPVSVVAFPPSQPAQIFDYTGTTLIYIGYASPVVNYNGIVGTEAFRWTRAATTLTSIVVSSNTGTVTTSSAHGLQIGQLVTVSGATVDTDLNASYYVQTVPSTTTITITTANVANATYNESTLVMSTQAPLTTQPVWAITKLTYDGSGNLVSKGWANGTARAYTNIWANRAVTTGSTKIYYQ